MLLSCTASARRLATRAAALVIVAGLSAGPVLAQPEAYTNLLANPSFEESDHALPTRWEIYSTKTAGAYVTDTAHQDGVSSLQMMAQGLPREFHGLVQRVSVVSGEKYTFSAKVMNDAGDPLKGMAYLQLCVEWQNAEGRELSRSFTSPQGQTLSRSRWKLLEIRKVKAPEEAVRAIVGIHLYEGERGGKGRLFVDDVSFGVATFVDDELAGSRNAK
jgi:hypothetical protein